MCSTSKPAPKLLTADDVNRAHALLQDVLQLQLRSKDHMVRGKQALPVRAGALLASKQLVRRC